MATSALAVVMSRPGTGVTCGRGRNWAGSTPTVTMFRRAGSTPRSVTMSSKLLVDTVTIRSRRRATRFCMRVKA